MAKKSIQINEIMKAYTPAYFLDENAEPHIQLAVDGVMRAYPIRSEEFQAFVQRSYFKATKEIANEKDFKSYKAISMIEANDSGIIYELPLRVAQAGDNIIYDLARQDGKQILITPEGWGIIPQQKLFRHQGLSAPLPVEGGSLEDLTKLLNIQDEDQKNIAIVSLLSFFIPNISHPLMILTGEQGSAKTTMAKIFKMIVDPAIDDVTYLNNSEHSMELILSRSYVTAFDNLSGISEATSDFLCRTITGGTSIRRRFYKDDAVRTTKLWRCVILNGINSVVTKPDLLDRSVLIELQRIPDSMRKCDDDIYGKFIESLPGILGAVFTILSKALKIRRDMTVNFELKRLADFTKNGYAIAEAIGSGKGEEFLNAYSENINAINTEIVESNPMIMPLIEYLNTVNMPAEILVSILYKGFMSYASKKFDAYTVRHLPQSPSLLSRELKSCISSIEKKGIALTFKRKSSDGQYICISRIEEPKYVVLIPEEQKTKSAEQEDKAESQIGKEEIPKIVALVPIEFNSQIYESVGQVIDCQQVSQVQ